MNKSDLKNFAINARLALLQRVADRAALYGIDEEKCQSRAIVPSSAFHMLDGSVLSAQEVGQRNALIARISKIGYRQTMEEAAYTWFNRLIAIRYMQQHSLLPVSMRVLPEAPGALPQILREAQDVSLPGVEPDQVLAMLDANRTDALYRYLLIALCNALGGWLPGMFQQITSVAELLFPAALLKADSVLGEMARLDDDCWNEIQVIGWLYQYYISQRHDEVVDINGSAIKKEDIPAATCLYTTDWVVRYMVENSLGRLWLEGHPSEALRMKWRYYVDEAPQEPAVAARLAQIRAPYAALQPDQLTVLDPCMGSGHILVYAFDVLMDIYRSVGYTDRDAVQSIVQNNLYGLDIDDRAAQLAYFAVMMKACEYDRRFLRRGVQPHVCAIAESVPLAELSPFGAEKALAQTLLDTFRDAKEYGSILHVPLSLADIRRLADRTAALQSGQHDTLLAMADNAQAAAAVQPLLAQAQILARQYDAVITNPPYMNKFAPTLKRYIQDNYTDYKADLFSVFMHRNFDFCKPNGYSAFMTPFVWMFIKSYEKLRQEIIQTKCINTLIQLEYSAFEEATVPICTFVLRNSALNYKGNYLRLSDFKGGMDVQNEMVLKAQEDPACKYRYTAQQDNFSKIPGAPVAYWVSEKTASIFTGESIGSYAIAVKGLDTCDNEKFVRRWQEVSISSIGFNIEDASSTYMHKWYPYTKGGGFRRWYGFYEMVVNWYSDGKDLKNLRTPNGKIKSRPQNTRFYFKSGLTWSSITSYKLSMRYMENSIFGGGGSAMFCEKNELFTLGILNSAVGNYFLSILNPTINFLVNDILSIPTVGTCKSAEKINGLVKQEIQLSKTDWDSFETSWDFKKHPMI